MGTQFTATAETALISAYILSMDGKVKPRSQVDVFEAAKAHYMAQITVQDAINILPTETGVVLSQAYAKAMDDLATCPIDDVPLVAEIIRAIADNIRDRAAGTLAQRDIDAAMDAVRAEMEFDRAIGNLPKAA